MAGNLQPLDEKFAIVTPDGRPTLYFIKWAQQRQIDITDGITLQDLIDYLTAHQLQEGSGIQITPDGSLNNNPTIAADAQEILDQISTTRGSVLYRNATDWVALAPGTAGQFLKTNGAGADPAWAAGGGSATPWWWSPPDPADFSLISGDATNPTFITDADIGTVLDFNSNAVGGDIMRAAVETITTPAAAWTYKIRMTPTTFNLNYCGAGFILRNVANNRNLTWMLGNGNELAIQRRTMTSFSSTPHTTISGSNANSSVVANLFLQITYDGSANITFSVSGDGKHWRLVYTEAVATYLVAVPDRIGFAAYTANAGSALDLNVSVGRRVKSW